MLVGFFKAQSDRDCDCRVVTFTDRIWLGDDGSAKVLRFFTLQVEKSSTAPLTDAITLLVPGHPTVSEQVRNINETCFNREYFFNRVKTAGCDIILVPLGDKSPRDKGTINLEGLEGVLVYTNLL